MMLDSVVIGAGPAGLFYADEYLRNFPEKSIAILDTGVSLSKRACPLVDKGSCSQCKVCLAVYGSGGAGMYSDGKLSIYPAGSGLASHLGSEQDVISLNDEVLDKIADRTAGFGEKRTRGKHSSVSPLALKSDTAGSQLKSYDVVHLGTEGIQVFCAKYEEELQARGVEFKWRHSVRKISRVDDGYEVICVNPQKGDVRLRARNIIFATGKASGTLIRKHFSDLGVAYEKNRIELGVRVETKREAINPLSSCHLDAKLKFEGTNDAEVRTFCVCNGGYLVSCYYDDFLEDKRICTISGFSFKNRVSDNSNFGLLVRQGFPKHIDPVQTQLGIVRAINAASGHDGTVVQRYGDFIAGRATTAGQLTGNKVQTTLKSSSPVDLNWILPGSVVENLRLGLDKLGQISPGIIDDDTLLHAPVWELVHDRPILNKSFETTAPNIYVIGDATGIARGIVQAASTGLWAARQMSTVSESVEVAATV